MEEYSFKIPRNSIAPAFVFLPRQILKNRYVMEKASAFASFWGEFEMLWCDELVMLELCIVCQKKYFLEKCEWNMEKPWLDRINTPRKEQHS